MKHELINLASYRAALTVERNEEEIIPQGIITQLEQEVRTVTGVQFSPKSRQLIVAAEEAAIAFKQRYVGTEHLLLALLREDFFCEDFRAIGINQELVERILLESGRMGTNTLGIRGCTNIMRKVALELADDAQERRLHYRKIVAVDWPIELLNITTGLGADALHLAGFDIKNDPRSLLLSEKFSHDLAKSE